MSQNWLHGVFLCVGVLIGLKMAAPKSSIQSKSLTSQAPEQREARALEAEKTIATKSSRAPSSVVAADPNLHPVETMPFAELSHFFYAAERKFRDSSLLNYAPRVNKWQHSTGATLDAWKTTSEDLLATRDRSSVWKAAASFDEAGHHVDVESVLRFDPINPAPADTTVKTPTENCYAAQTEITFDGDKDNAMHLGSFSCEGDMRYHEGHGYMELDLYQSQKSSPTSLMLLPPPVSSPGQPQYYSNAKQEWIYFSGFDWAPMRPEEIQAEQTQMRASAAAESSDSI